MTQEGFYIREVRIRGRGVPDAYLSFKKGTNVVCGTSDTGKSYVFSLISYGLGRSKIPKQIPEAQNYKDLYIEIETYGLNKIFTLNRKLSTNKIRVLEQPISEWKNGRPEIKEFDVKNSQKPEKTISQFLLSLCGLESKVLLKSKHNKTTQLFSFNNLIQYFFVPEDRIITEGSPFYPSGQNTSKSAEQSLLNLLLTGNDFSDMKEVENVAKKKVNLKARMDYINTRIATNSKKNERLLTELKNSVNTSNASDYSDLKLQLESYLSKINELATKKVELINEINDVRNKINYYSELLDKFAILKSQYSSDLERLEFIIEAEDYSSQLGDSNCPVCGSLINDDHSEHFSHIQNFKEAVAIEFSKIETKLLDLNSTISLRKNEISAFQSLIQDLERQLNQLDFQIESNYKVRVNVVRGAIDNLLKAAKIENELRFVNQELARLYSERREIQELIDKKKDNAEDTSIVSSYDLHNLSTNITNRLKKWRFEKNINVSFDNHYQVFDIIVSGKPRRAFGKGKRAILYSACLLGILDFTKANNKKFSNLIILDSPLTTFKGKNETAKEMLDNEGSEIRLIKQQFYKDLAEPMQNTQVIIFDNVIPDRKLSKGINVQIFTDEELIGRQGFF